MRGPTLLGWLQVAIYLSSTSVMALPAFGDWFPIGKSYHDDTPSPTTTTPGSSVGYLSDSLPESLSSDYSDLTLDPQESPKFAEVINRYFSTASDIPSWIRRYSATAAPASYSEIDEPEIESPVDWSNPYVADLIAPVQQRLYPYPATAVEADRAYYLSKLAKSTASPSPKKKEFVPFEALHKHYKETGGPQFSASRVSSSKPTTKEFKPFEALHKQYKDPAGNHFTLGSDPYKNFDQVVDFYKTGSYTLNPKTADSPVSTKTAAPDNYRWNVNPYRAPTTTGWGIAERSVPTNSAARYKTASLPYEYRPSAKAASTKSAAPVNYLWRNDRAATQSAKPAPTNSAAPVNYLWRNDRAATQSAKPAPTDSAAPVNYLWRNDRAATQSAKPASTKSAAPVNYFWKNDRAATQSAKPAPTNSAAPVNYFWKNDHDRAPTTTGWGIDERSIPTRAAARYNTDWQHEYVQTTNLAPTTTAAIDKWAWIDDIHRINRQNYEAGRSSERSAQPTKRSGIPTRTIARNAARNTKYALAESLRLTEQLAAERRERAAARETAPPLPVMEWETGRYGSTGSLSTIMEEPDSLPVMEWDTGSGWSPRSSSLQPTTLPEMEWEKPKPARQPLGDLSNEPLSKDKSTRKRIPGLTNAPLSNWAPTPANSVPAYSSQVRRIPTARSSALARPSALARSSALARPSVLAVPSALARPSVLAVPSVRAVPLPTNRLAPPRSISLPFPTATPEPAPPNPTYDFTFHLDPPRERLLSQKPPNFYESAIPKYLANYADHSGPAYFPPDVVHDASKPSGYAFKPKEGDEREGFTGYFMERGDDAGLRSVWLDRNGNVGEEGAEGVEEFVLGSALSQGLREAEVEGGAACELGAGECKWEPKLPAAAKEDGKATSKGGFWPKLWPWGRQ